MDIENFLTIEKKDAKGVIKEDKIALGFQRPTGYVEDKFFKALSKAKADGTPIKLFGITSKYIDTESTDTEGEYQKAIVKALKNQELSVDELEKITSKSVNPEERRNNRYAKIEALQACALVDSKYNSQFVSKPDSEFWQQISTAEIDNAIAFFRARNSI